MPHCDDCTLSGQMVRGSGVRGRYAIVGEAPEAPGATEVRQRKPFVGKSGQLLRRALTLVGVDPETDVWYTNACLCRPEQGTPEANDVQACRGRLITELAAARPQRILTLGAVAAMAVLQVVGPITSLHGWTQTSPELGVPVTMAVHPAYYLRNPDGFGTFLRDLEKFATDKWPSEEPPDAPFKICQTAAQVHQELQPQNDQRGFIACDVETTGKPREDATLVQVGVGLPDRDYVVVIPGALLKQRVAREALRAVLQQRKFAGSFTVGHNARFDSQWLETVDIWWDWDYDTILLHYILDEQPRTHDLEQLARYYLNRGDYSSHIKRDVVNGRADQLPPLVLGQYLANDVDSTRRLAPILLGLMSPKQQQLYQTLVGPADIALRDIESWGVQVDPWYLQQLDKRLARAELKQNVALRAVGIRHGMPDLNVRSPKQLATLLYDKMRIPPVQGRGRSTDKEVLRELEPRVPFVQQLREFREAAKFRSTYVRGMLERRDADDRIHPEFRLFGTVTGRLSCRDPNLQNVPARAGDIIRNAFVAPPGHVLIEADYGQLEMRVAAELSSDPALIAAFNSGYDIHTQTATLMYDVAPEEVTKVQRFWAKAVNFGILYGRSAKSLASPAEGGLNCSVSEAQRYIDAFFRRYKRLAAWREEQTAIARKRGYLETDFGRRRRFPLITGAMLKHMTNQCANTPVQSTASDITLAALVRLHDVMYDSGEAWPVMTIHDSLVFEVLETKLDEWAHTIYREMIKVPYDRVPFPVDIEVGSRWGDAKEYPIRR